MLDFASLQYTNLSPECWYWNVSKRTIYVNHLSDTEQELEKKYNCIFDQNPIHWAELTGPNPVSVPFANNRKGWYKSIVGRWPKMMISVARFSQDNLGARWSILRDTDKANNVRPIPQFLVTFRQWIYIIPICCWQREHWLPDWSQSTPPNELGFDKKYSYTFFELLICIRKMPIVYSSFKNVSISALRG